MDKSKSNPAQSTHKKWLEVITKSRFISDYEMEVEKVKRRLWKHNRMSTLYFEFIKTIFLVFVSIFLFAFIGQIAEFELFIGQTNLIPYIVIMSFPAMIVSMILFLYYVFSLFYENKKARDICLIAVGILGLGVFLFLYFKIFRW